MHALSQSYTDSEDLGAVFERVSRVVASTIQACDEASISILDARGRITTASATSQVAVELDNQQYESGQGPCVSVLRGDPSAAYSSDLGTDDRWPEFGRAAAERGFRSLLSRHFDARHLLGSVNLYARQADAFGADDDATAATLAAFAGVVTALSYERIESAQLREALQTRDVIGQAKGVLMEREKVTPDEAFAKLRRASQQLNRKLRDLAEEIAATGATPTDLR